MIHYLRSAFDQLRNALTPSARPPAPTGITRRWHQVLPFCSSKPAPSAGTELVKRSSAQRRSPLCFIKLQPTVLASARPTRAKASARSRKRPPPAFGQRRSTASAIGEHGPACCATSSAHKAIMRPYSGRPCFSEGALRPSKVPSYMGRHLRPSTEGPRAVRVRVKVTTDPAFRF